ncbi:MAG: dihydrolipoyl dehydrogenase [candidate division Zixibacteria bacterium]|nr:dihydrolipoyl dehydrogenase [candidate division Zixibacteria bacterium]
MNKGGKNLVIIGAGPAGYVGAIRAAQLGANVTLVEKEEVGGTCLNVGCIPTKVLTSAAYTLSSLKHAGRWGLNVHGTDLDFSQLMKRKQMVANRLVSGVKSLLKARGVNFIKGTATFLDEKKIEVRLEDGTIEKLEADKFLIATGSVPIQLPIPGIESEGVIDSTGALSLTSVPKSMLIIGGGAIGCEFAYIYHSFGTKIIIVEVLSQILPGEDEEIASSLRNSIERSGIKIFTSSKVSQIAPAKDGKMTVIISASEGEINVEVEKILVSVGRKANTKDMGLEKLGIKMNRGTIVVDDHLRTNVPHIFSAGDCIGNWLLAHVASMEAEIAVENALGEDKRMDYTAVPCSIYTHPEIGSVGLNEKQAKEKGLEVKTGKFPMVACGRAQAENEIEGFVKVVVEKASGKILGAQILGHRATDLIAELTLAIQMGAKTQDIIDTIHAHPTLSEPIREAALKAEGRPIHMM